MGETCLFPFLHIFINPSYTFLKLRYSGERNVGDYILENNGYCNILNVRVFREFQIPLIIVTDY